MVSRHDTRVPGPPNGRADVSTSGSGSLTDLVRDTLSSEIASGALAPGAQLPTERALSRDFGVSRVTVRRALGELTERGLVSAVQGKGTFVTAQHLTEPPNVLLSFHDLVVRENLTISARVLRSEVRASTVREAEIFAIAPGAPLFDLERLRLLDDLPVAVDSTLLPLSIDPDLPEADWSEESLYQRLRDAGHAPAAADYALEARAADPVRAEVLGCEPGSPLLVAESQTYDVAGRLVVTGQISYRGDRYRFHSTVRAGDQRLVPAHAPRRASSGL